MCTSNDLYSYCNWIVPRRYGKCKCQPDHYYSSKDQRCYPRLSHNCFKNSDCEKGTKYSKCGNMNDQKNTIIIVKASVRKHDKNKLTNKPKHHHSSSSLNYSSSSKLTNTARTGYRSISRQRQSSRQSKLAKNFKHSTNANDQEQTNKCRCQAEFKENEDKTNCIKVQSLLQFSSSIAPIASASNLDESHFLIKPFKPFLSLNSSINFQPVSIGKRCNNSYECTLRDPYTQCSRNGVCECINRNSKCNAHSNGCHSDTFQCSSDGKCISWYFVCDQQKNCDDNSDESACIRFNCPKLSFQCLSNGQCISRGLLCDGNSFLVLTII